MADQSFLGILRVQIAAGGTDELPLYKPTVKLGRGRDNDVILDDPKVSSHHAQLSFGREGWLVGDLNSRNGRGVFSKATP